jgi:hypothetical protein
LERVFQEPNLTITRLDGMKEKQEKNLSSRISTMRAFAPAREAELVSLTPIPYVSRPARILFTRSIPLKIRIRSDSPDAVLLAEWAKKTRRFAADVNRHATRPHFRSNRHRKLPHPCKPFKAVRLNAMGKPGDADGGGNIRIAVSD